MNLADIDPSIKFMGKALSFPLIISSMTGGADEELVKINRTPFLGWGMIIYSG